MGEGEVAAKGVPHEFIFTISHSSLSVSVFLSPVSISLFEATQCLC